MVPTLGASPPHPNFGAVRSVAPATHPSPPQPSIHRQALSLSHSGPPAKMAVSASAIALCCLLVSPAALRITTVTLPPSFFFFCSLPTPFPREGTVERAVVVPDGCRAGSGPGETWSWSFVGGSFGSFLLGASMD